MCRLPASIVLALYLWGMSNGGSDLFVSFRQNDGPRGDALNLGNKVNTNRDDAYGSVTPDGRFFFFHRIDLDDGDGVANIYWVDASIIETLRMNDASGAKEE